MTKTNPSAQVLVFSTQTLKKLLLSSMVVLTFAAYAVRERLTGADASSAATATPTSGMQPSNKSTLQLSSSSGSSSNNVSSVSSRTYRDGQFTGDTADAYWGNVEVQATIQDGKITDVQFLDYP